MYVKIIGMYIVAFFLQKYRKNVNSKQAHPFKFTHTTSANFGLTQPGNVWTSADHVQCNKLGFKIFCLCLLQFVLHTSFLTFALPGTFLVHNSLCTSNNASSGLKLRIFRRLIHKAPTQTQLPVKTAAQAHNTRQNAMQCHDANCFKGKIDTLKIVLAKGS